MKVLLQVRVLLAVVLTALISGFIFSGAASAIISDIDPSSTCCGLDHGWNWIDNSGATSNELAQIALPGVPYPLAEIKAMGGKMQERVNLRERLLRFANPDKIGYLYEISPFTGKPFGYYTIRGKVSSTQSQMTTAEQRVGCNGNSSCIISSVGDDGTWGPEEFGGAGVFFFTTTGVMIELNCSTVICQYQDAPLPLSVPSFNPTKAPSSVSKYFKKK